MSTSRLCGDIFVQILTVQIMTRNRDNRAYSPTIMGETARSRRFQGGGSFEAKF